MATYLKDLPPGSQQSSSSLSDPPEYTDDEMRDIALDMAPVTRRQSAYFNTIKEPETNGKEAHLPTLAGNKSPSNDDEIAAEIQVSPKATRRRVPSKRSQLSEAKPTTSRQPAAKRPKTSSKKWEPNHITQSSKSPLVGRDLRALLLNPLAWEVLSDEDRSDIIALFPDEKHILEAGTPNARPDLLSLQNDDNFRHDTEDYVSNLSKDMHDPSWLQDAWAAHGSRAAGNFDQFYIMKLEADWKTTIPENMKPENLRSAPELEDFMVLGQSSESDETAADHGVGDHYEGNIEVGSFEAGNIDVGGTIIASGISGSVNEEEHTNGDRNIKADVINREVVESDVDDGLLTSGVNGIEKVSDAKVDETDCGHSDKMQTGPE